MDLLRLAKPTGILTLTATTTATPQTVTIQQLTHRVPTVVDWGDGSRDTVAANYTGTHTHAYAVPGTYNITVHRAQHITALDIRVPQIGGLNTAQLRACRDMHTFYLSFLTATDIVVNSADMTGWGLSYRLFLANCPNVNGTLNSADMTGWGLSAQFLLLNCPNVVYVCGAPGDMVWTGIRNFSANNVSATLATVENTIAGFHSLKPTMTRATGTQTLNLGGASNATSGGTYQDICPPTSALEQVYDLINGNCTPAGPEFGSVVWNGGSAP